ncbi:MAG: alpha-glucan family phosphorylase [Candidatus Hydrogenedens sp.]|nr:alpha-glucan family phosphorylase [Candidatus Hydrogenedens sp.]
MPTFNRYTVIPSLPERLQGLLTIANNVWWCWSPEAVQLFHRVDRRLWTECGQNPRLMLGKVSQIRLEELANDDSFLAHLDRVSDALERYCTHNHWFDRNPGAPKEFLAAYMSAEFGLHESLKLYSGGLGVLAGDHLKAASDLALPLIGVGLLYREGYFSQYLNADGWQQERYPRNDFYNMPLEKITEAGGEPMVIEVPYPGRTVKAWLWKLQVGRVPLYLLDADHPENAPEDRVITDKLYGGDHEARVRQEILLGMGGVIALHKLNLHPTIYHMNEGHSAFMALQRIRDVMKAEKLSFEQAVESVKSASIFTTHTPVPAGNDMFGPPLIEKYFSDFCREVGISMQQLMALGRQNPDNAQEDFCMTVLALKLAAGANGVSRLHGEVARDMWKETWKGVPVDEVPITSITNGIHAKTWISQEMGELYDRYLGPGWENSPDDQAVWERVDEIPDSELWRTHERRRERLVDFARKRLYNQYKSRGASSAELRICNEVLDPEALTIGFARRFATYKRGALFLRDKERIREIILKADRPVQFIIAGKAHPADNAGKQVIREIMHFAREADVRRNVIYIEDYDMNVARYMVQGVDCWLNNPRRPMEASGTSGMKAALNGGLNISILDGWWCEAVELGPNGWSIGQGESYESPEEQDAVESEALYDILEQEVAPCFYERPADGLPRNWMHRMKTAIRTCGPVFNTYRMVQEYTDRFYVPCSRRRVDLLADKRKRSIALAAWKSSVRSAWPQVSIHDVKSGDRDQLAVGCELDVSAVVSLGSLTPEDVTVEVFYGPLDPQGCVTSGRTAEMKFIGEKDGASRYEGKIPCETTGELGFTVRAVPYHVDLWQKHEMALIAWA